MATAWMRSICVAWVFLVPLFANAVTPRVAAGGYQGVSCSLDTAGRLTCWGSDVAGQLGQGRPQQVDVPTLIGNGYMLPSRTGNSVMAAGGAHSIALNADGFKKLTDDLGKGGHTVVYFENDGEGREVPPLQLNDMYVSAN